MVDLERLYRLALEKSQSALQLRKRYAYSEILSLIKNTQKSPTILLSGLRGVGKTTLLLQLFSELGEGIFISADSILLKDNTLYDIAQDANRNGYKRFYIDEIHFYQNWQVEIKNIYDDFNISVICSGSSIAAIKKGAIGLGRRAIEIDITNLTLGEYIYLKEGQSYKSNLTDATDRKKSIEWLAKNNLVEKHYLTYLKYGGFPFSVDEKMIFSLVKKMIFEDALAEFNLSQNKVDVAQKILAFLASSNPGEFSYTSFSAISGHSKSSVYEGVSLLKELGIIREITERSSKAAANSKVKLLFSHPNLRHAFATELFKEASFGALREEYFLFHMANLGQKYFVPKQGQKTPDYEIPGLGIFEIGGESKGKDQIKDGGTIFNDLNLIVLGCVQKIDRN